MNLKPHHHRHYRYSERHLIFYFAVFLVMAVLALLGLFLWWTNKPQFGP